MTTTEPPFTLEEMARVQAEIATLVPQPIYGWDGQVRRTQMLPYDVQEPDGTVQRTHAVLVGKVMYVSQQAWDALMRASTAGGAK